jgi:hypothetical protein
MEVENDLAAILPELLAMGFTPIRSQYTHSSFGNYFVDFAGTVRPLRIIRDRGQYIVGGKRDELEPVGLWQAFNSRDEFARKLLSWLRLQIANQATAMDRNAYKSNDKVIGWVIFAVVILIVLWILTRGYFARVWEGLMSV